MDKIRVLFVCRQNAARSQMAAGLLNHLAGDRFAAESAGLEPGELNPYAVQAMAMAGIDISESKPQSVFDLYKRGELYRYVITVCDADGHERCPIFPGISQRLAWSFPDPAGFSGSGGEILSQTIEVREMIRKKVEGFISAFSPGEEK
jgi:arsenate reductase